MIMMMSFDSGFLMTFLASYSVNRALLQLAHRSHKIYPRNPTTYALEGGFTRKSSQKSIGRQGHTSNDTESTFGEESILGSSSTIRSFPEKQALNNNGMQFLLQIASSLRRTNGDFEQHLTDVLNTAFGGFRQKDNSILDVDSLDSIAERCHQLDKTITSP